MAIPSVFLDRDGTLVEERHYLKDPEQVALIPGAAEAVRIFREKGYAVFVVSNQSGIARGLITHDELRAVHARFEQLLAAEKASLDGYFYCVHGPGENCLCRKPRPGLVPKAWRGEAIDFVRSYVVGDKDADLGLADTLGARGLLVLTGYGEETARELQGKKQYPIFDHVLAAAKDVPRA